MTGHVPAIVQVRGLIGHQTTQLAAGVAITLAQRSDTSLGHVKLLASDWRVGVMVITIEAATEGFDWVRGWDNEAVNAMLAARALR